MSDTIVHTKADRIGTVAETVILITCLVYLTTNEFWALLLWEGFATTYLIVGAIVVWRGKRAESTQRDEARSASKWMWAPPVLAAIVGVDAAIDALIAKSSNGDVHATVLMITASLAIILSWMLLQVGFAEIYEVISATDEHPQLEFPGGIEPTTLDYLYFSFTLGASFATSDVEVVGRHTRRLVLIHSVVGFFFNALVVAVAFQIIQGLIN